MTSKALLAYCRTRLDDLVGESSTVLFPDSEIYGYLSDCQERVAEECLVLRDSSTASVCTIAVDIGDNIIPISPSILQIDAVRYTQGTVNKILSRFASHQVPLTISDGDPSYYNLEVNPGSITLDKKPLAAAVVSLRARRTPLNVVSGSSELEIPENYHRRLVNGVLGYCFMKPDTETYNVKKADGYFALFKEDIEKIKRMDIKLHGFGVRFR